MANQKKLTSGRHASAIKRHRQSIKRYERNKPIKSETRTYVKKLRSALESNKKEEAKDLLSETVSKLHKAASKGIIPKKRASRLSSRLSKAINKAS